MSADKTLPASPPRPPLRELLERYRAVFKASWAARHELAGPKRLADEVAFLPAALSLQDTPVHPAPRRAAIALCALFLAALLWSIVGQVDIVVPGADDLGELSDRMRHYGVEARDDGRSVAFDDPWANVIRVTAADGPSA